MELAKHSKEIIWDESNYKTGGYAMIRLDLLLSTKFCCLCGKGLSLSEQGYIVCDSCFIENEKKCSVIGKEKTKQYKENKTESIRKYNREYGKKRRNNPDYRELQKSYQKKYKINNISLLSNNLIDGN